MTLNQAPENTRFMTRLVRNWFELTGDEQRALLLILVLLLLGVTVKCVHLKNERAGHLDQPLVTSNEPAVKK